MLTAVIIDDERPSIRELEYLLHHLSKDHRPVQVVGKFTDPLDAIQAMSALRPDVVFLDVKMPQFDGLEAAETIQRVCSKSKVVFVTAYDSYAIQAFDLRVFDYLLKPISSARLAKTVSRLLECENTRSPMTTSRLKVRCLGGFDIYWNEAPIKWRTQKTRELFAFLIHKRATTVTKDCIIGNLWPELDMDMASHRLHNGIYYIRKTLQEYGIGRSLISVGGNYRLKIGDIDLDIHTFTRDLPNNFESLSLDKLQAITSVYEGEYFSGEDWPWAEIERQRLIQLYSKMMIALAFKYESAGNFERAEESLLRTYNQNSFDDKVIEALFELYARIKCPAKLAKHYKDHERLLRDELGIEPPERLKRIYRSIRSN